MFLWLIGEVRFGFSGYRVWFLRVQGLGLGDLTLSAVCSPFILFVARCVLVLCECFLILCFRAPHNYTLIYVVILPKPYVPVWVTITLILCFRAPHSYTTVDADGINPALHPGP